MCCCVSCNSQRVLSGRGVGAQRSSPWLENQCFHGASAAALPLPTQLRFQSWGLRGEGEKVAWSEEATEDETTAE